MMLLPLAIERSVRQWTAIWYCVGIGIAVALLIFTAWMLIDALANETTPGDKALWSLIIVIVPIFGPFMYLFVRRTHRSPV